MDRALAVIYAVPGVGWVVATLAVLLYLIAANVTGTAFAASVSLGWLGLQIQASSADPLLHQL